MKLLKHIVGKIAAIAFFILTLPVVIISQMGPIKGMNERNGKLYEWIFGKCQSMWFWADVRQDTEVVDMTAAEKNIITRFANGHDILRDEAIEIHRKYIPILGVRGSPEQDFMAEVDNPCPDGVLKELYRTILKEKSDA